MVAYWQTYRLDATRFMRKRTYHASQIESIKIKKKQDSERTDDADDVNENNGHFIKFFCTTTTDTTYIILCAKE
jgi:hypothetical protein